MSDTQHNLADPAPDLEQIVEIHAPAVDVTRVMAEIRQTLLRHGPFAQPDVPSFGVATEDGEGALALYLSQANLNYDQVWVEVNIVGRKVPLLGGLVMRLKAALHELAVYYVNLHAGKQIDVNASLVRIVNALSRKSEQDVNALRDEIALLRARIAELETRK
jgi:hypothetical protein